MIVARRIQKETLLTMLESAGERTRRFPVCDDKENYGGSRGTKHRLAQWKFGLKKIKLLTVIFTYASVIMCYIYSYLSTYLYVYL